MEDKDRYRLERADSEAFLVCDHSLKCLDAPFFKFIRDKGYKLSGRHGNYGCCSWAYVDIGRKLYTYGMPGIPLAHPIGNHAITIDEFHTIYSIYEKYEGKDMFTFHSERFDYDR